MEPSSAEQADVRQQGSPLRQAIKRRDKDAKNKKWEKMRKELIAEGHKEFECKTAVQMRDSMWSVTKTRTIGKLDKAKKTGTGGNQKFTELEKLLLAIVDTESSQVVGLDVSESGKLCPTGSGKKKPVKRSAPPSSINADIEYMIKKKSFESSV
uniref:Regulatory protein zeste n=1 Tax=Ditylenchus dipsaci TaxID=166011 RepID=A0A915D8D9_9BILA